MVPSGHSKYTYNTEDNVHDWKKVLADVSSPYAVKTWESCKSFVALCVKFGPPGPWVDLGCGIGHFVECCVRYGINCEGLEGDPNAADLAQDRYKGLRIRTFNLQEKLPYNDASIAVAFCNQVLEHVLAENTELFLKEVRRMLMPGGLFFVNMPNKYNKDAKKEESHINLMGPTELNKALIEAGFDAVWPANYPRFIFGKSTLGKILAGLLYFVFPADRLSSNASALAFAGAETVKKKIFSSRYFHIRKLLSW